MAGSDSQEIRADAKLAELRLVMAFATLPMFAALLMYGLCLGLWSADLWVFEGTPSADGAASLALSVGIIALVMAIFGAVPAVAWLTRRGSASLPGLLAAGAVIGNVPIAVIIAGTVLVQSVRGGLSRDVFTLWGGPFGIGRAIALGLFFGMASAVFLWVIAIRPRPLRRARDAEG
jgi:hypothetical protein